MGSAWEAVCCLNHVSHATYFVHICYVHHSTMYCIPKTHHNTPQPHHTPSTQQGQFYYLAHPLRYMKMHCDHHAAMGFNGTLMYVHSHHVYQFANDPVGHLLVEQGRLLLVRWDVVPNVRVCWVCGCVRERDKQRERERVVMSHTHSSHTHAHTPMYTPHTPLNTSHHSHSHR